MSAINIFALENVFVFPGTRCECVRTVAEDVLQNSRVPVVSPKWTVEVDSHGTRRLLQHWFKNEKTLSGK